MVRLGDILKGDKQPSKDSVNESDRLIQMRKDVVTQLANKQTPKPNPIIEETDEAKDLMGAEFKKIKEEQEKKYGVNEEQNVTHNIKIENDFVPESPMQPEESEGIEFNLEITYIGYHKETYLLRVNTIDEYDVFVQNLSQIVQNKSIINIADTNIVSYNILSYKII